MLWAAFLVSPSRGDEIRDLVDKITCRMDVGFTNRSWTVVCGERAKAIIAAADSPEALMAVLRRAWLVAPDADDDSPDPGVYLPIWEFTELNRNLLPFSEEDYRFFAATAKATDGYKRTAAIKCLATAKRVAYLPASAH